MRRRKFIALSLGVAVSWPSAARAQAPEQMRRIGVLMSYAENDSDAQAWVTAFRESLQKLGWMEGRNIRFDIRWAWSDLEAIQRFSRELIALHPDVVLSQVTPTTAALLQQTRTIPIVFAMVADPVASGFVANLSRPGGQVTGFTTLEGSLGGKWLELLKEVAPRVTRAAVLFNPTTAATFAESYLNSAKASAASLRVEVLAAPVHDTSELESVVAGLAREPNSGLIVIPESFMYVHRAQVTSLSARYQLPAVYPYRQFVELGGLLSYGVDRLDNFRRAAGYVDRILRGEKPADLPVQTPTNYELVVNLKAANALGLDVPWFLQQRANEVIE